MHQWYKVASKASWRNLPDVRRTYPHADGVRTRRGETLTVFNISGNKYRLVVRIRYDFQLVSVRHVLTHREYDSGVWKE
ncbi:MAG TPA: type II toxin-antitoxin system HigB family toxin [Phycisphaerae bacterium]|nr:type II toxin-antitoxin system HigB family toxin [Phycisphaerae bacterium]